MLCSQINYSVEIFVYILTITLLAQHVRRLSLCSQTTPVSISPYLNALPIVQALTKHNSKPQFLGIYLARKR